MNTPFTPWIDLTLMQAQQCHRLAWFLYGCLEREHVLNQKACAAWWVRELASSPGVRGPGRCSRSGAAPCSRVQN